MANYHDLLFLRDRIDDILSSSDISNFSQEILEFAHEEVKCVEEIAERMFWSSTSSLDLAFRLEMLSLNKFEDAVHQIISQSTDGARVKSIINPQNLKRRIHFFIKRLKKKQKEYSDGLGKLWGEEEGDGVLSSRSDFGEDTSRMVGLSDLYDQIKNKLINNKSTSVQVVSLVGMPGIGKTNLAKKIFEDAATVEHFDCRAWVTVGAKCQSKEILARRVLAVVNPYSNQMVAEGDEESTIYEYLKESLKGRRYLIVLDDVWNRYMALNLQPSILDRRKELKNDPFPDEKNGSRILLTSRLQQGLDHDLTMRLLDKEESWDLLRERVFGEKPYPSQLEKAGKKIAEKCDGLPLTIVTVADLLSKEEETPEYWTKVAMQKNHKLLIAAYDEISKVLLPSYKYLPPILQMCFLYMGVFPQDYMIPRSKFTNLLNADGALELSAHKFRSLDAMGCLEELVSNSLVMIYQRTMDRTQIKTFGLHSSLWHLSNREAGRTKFSHVLNSRDDGLGEALKNQYRLSFHNNILFGIKDVYKSVGDNCASTAHSILCYGLYHQYQVPICFHLRLLRVLDALTIRFYEFPVEVLQLIELRYLALTLNQKLPASISQLSNLQFLIVNQHISVNFHRVPLYLPMEIWNMEELQHLQVMGSDLPDPPCDASLKKLLTLSNVSAHSCTENVLKAIPNLTKLGIRIELAPDDDGKWLNCFNHISHLSTLTSLKCVIVNPEIIMPPAPLPIFPWYLEKLSLGGLGYPWEEMSKIALLPWLRVLKLQNYAFRGPKWEVEQRGFFSLDSLVIEDTDLVEWKIGGGSFFGLTYLSIKDCYKLERIHGEFEMFLNKIELIDCNPLGVEEMKKAVSAKLTWVDGKLKT